MCDIKMICAFAKVSSSFRNSKLYDNELLTKILTPYFNEVCEETINIQDEVKQYMQTNVLIELMQIRYVFNEEYDEDTMCSDCYTSEMIYNKVHICSKHYLQYGNPNTILEQMSYVKYKQIITNDCDIDKTSYLINRPGFTHISENYKPTYNNYYNGLSYDEKIMYNRKVILPFIRAVRYINYDIDDGECYSCYFNIDKFCDDHIDYLPDKLYPCEYLVAINVNQFFNINAYYIPSRCLRHIGDSDVSYVHNSDFSLIHPVRLLTNLNRPIYLDPEYYTLLKHYYETTEWN
jgi:hypothetical protein